VDEIGEPTSIRATIQAMTSTSGAFVAHLLVVDDDSDIVDALRELLCAEGHEVHTASTGEEGLVVLRASPLPDALILDVDMPVLGGPGMARKMLLHDAGEEKIPIILMSGSENLPEIAREMGTSYVIKKPATIRTFLTVLDRALRERRGPLSA
jgi:CheY-like chemotaxis protein